MFKNRSDISVKDIAHNNRFTVIHYWASWCLPCIKEFPVLKKQSEITAAAKTAKVVLVSIDSKTGPWKDAITKYGLQNFTHYLDYSKPTFLSSRLDTKAIPFNLLVDQNGKILEYDFKTSEIMNIVKKYAEK